ncbi:hypothetical protein QRO08_15730 [Paracidovorax citrulli]|uniref:Uncharacterized protein n=2 Tax=Paracidovorax citrulli TaxID=80869 RepID=A1TN36_PARC0|nr:hypothetical protein [Paracidovorax citrulli]ABM32374.1 hypothetical protein Aave_1789 [Paracidovorax citrulli AAC00-1]ATG94607.1 hypothetical protein CQB05_11715 [Paracidovorax citrulli]MVT38653.1 hypothetical protein [Paracidovorax citrulli]PVY66589.1 hypothetical protein C8E08_3999 [Paracidovorax citrulli]REG69244.1 hypothetical protein C8E07_2389 [Paracidovorax citrulli]
MRKPDMDTVRDTIKALAILIVLVGGGAGIGYGIGTERARVLLVDERQDRLQEIDRLQRTHQRALDIIAGRQERAADTLAAAADTAATAAETAQAAAATAGKAAKAAGVPPAVPEHERKAINATIQRANERLRKESPR